MQLYEVALAEGETSRDLIARGRELGLGRLTATTELSPDQLRRLYPGRPAPVVGPGGRGPTVGAPAVDAPAGSDGAPRPPRMGLVSAAVVAAVVVVALGMALAAGGRAEERPDPTAASESLPDDRTGAADALRAADGRALCAGWPPVAGYWEAFAAEMQAAPDVAILAGWAEDNHRAAAVALRDQLGPAFGGGSDEVRDVLRWVFDTAYPSADWDLDQVRLVTDAVAPAVIALAQSAATTC